MAPDDITQHGKFVEVEAARRARDSDAARNLAAVFEDGQCHATHIRCKFEVVESVALGADSGERPAQFFGIGNRIRRDLSQPSGDLVEALLAD